MSSSPVSAPSGKIEELKRRMGELARAGYYEQAEQLKLEVVNEIKRRRESVIRSLIEEGETQEKRMQEAVKAETGELEDTCKRAIVAELRRFKNQVDVVKQNFIAKKSLEVDKQKTLISCGPRVSRRYLELKEIEKIKAHEGDFRGARIQQQLAEKAKLEDNVKFEKTLSDELDRKIKVLKLHMDDEMKLLKAKLEEHVDLIETHTKEKQKLVELKWKASSRRSLIPKNMSSSNCFVP